MIEQPLQLPGGLNLPNRLAKAAMTEGQADARGSATAAHERLYASWAQGGAGLLITGNVLVDPRYLEAPGNVVIDPGIGREARTALAAFAKAARTSGARVVMQLSHAGRQTPKLVSQRPIAPSAVALDMPGRSLYPFAPPRGMTVEEIHDTIARFAHAARIARETGFDGVQVHAAHGYLISQFLSPLTNRREDEWGGTPENRMRFLLDVLRACRREAGEDFALAVKLNSSDFQRGGFGPQDAMAVIDALAPFGLAFIEVSGGTYEQPQMMGIEGKTAPSGLAEVRPSTRAREGYFLGFARSLRARTAIPLMLTGGFRTREGMVAALEEGACDLIGLARPLCAAPDAPGRLIRGEITALPRFEAELKGGPFGMVSPARKGLLLRTVGGWGQQAWFLRQISRMGQGRPPRPGFGLMASLIWMQGRMKAQERARSREASRPPQKKGSQPPSSPLRQD
jgi:2,4-dienoyl-CoA reductase-like NADH-dependent reductase (Old Yellow Enzyme family)